MIFNFGRMYILDLFLRSSNSQNPTIKKFVSIIPSNIFVYWNELDWSDRFFLFNQILMKLLFKNAIEFSITHMTF